MRRNKWNWAALGLVVVSMWVVVAGAAFAVDITGYFETVGTMDWTEEYPLLLDNTLSLNLNRHLDGGALHGRFLIQQSVFRTPLASWRWDVDELYADYYAAEFDLRIGKQRLAWGTALQINPMDVVNPLDPEDPFGDKQSTWAALVDYYIGGNFKLSAAVVPVFDTGLTPTMLHPITGEKIPVEDPAVQLTNMQAAVKIAGQGLSGWDAALMYYYGREQRPGLSQGYGGNAQPSFPVEGLRLQYPRTHVIGVSTAGTLANVGLWLEGALHYPESGDAYLHWIAGGDYGFSNGVLAVAQYYQRWQGGDLQHQILLALEKDFRGLHAMRLAGLYRLNTGSWMVRPEIEWSLAEAMHLTTGVQWLNEKAETPANRLPVQQADALRWYATFRIDF